MNKLVSILGATLALSLPAGAATIVNGSFEDVGSNSPTASGDGYAVYSAIPGWTTASGLGIEIQTDGAVPQIDAQDGENYVELDSDPDGNSNSSMKQSVALTVGSYILSFYYSPREENNVGNTNLITYSIGSLAASITGPQAGPPVTAVGSWTLIEAMFSVATDASYDLTFAAGGTEEKLGGFIDNVSIAAVPLPAGALLMLTAVGGFGIARRFKRG